MKGPSGIKGYGAAAKRLQITLDEVEQAVSTIASIFVRAARLNLSKDQMLEFLADLSFHDASRQALAEFFSQRAHEIRSMVSVPILYVPSYQRLDWRLDVQIASRSLLNQSHPSFLLKLSTKSFHSRDRFQVGAISREHKEKHVKYFEADYVTLKRICEQLEQALAERKGAHCRRVIRQFK
ncbi:hypothetical protein O6H91_09G092000 [Diphasiastrum complanatum]|nr:hypothetical protein O6H91_09G092000 [Diphasiastrum complanatum]